MDDEIEDIVGDVQLTDSQKSVATTNAYYQDFTDSSSEKNNSSGKDTYVIECDSDDSDAVFKLHGKQSVINLNDKPDRAKENSNKLTKTKVNANKKITVETKLTDTHVHCDQSLNRSTTTSLQRCYFVAQETFTQTSKTIFELAQTDGAQRTADYKAIETQTSCVSIIEDKTIEYRIEVTGSRTQFTRNEIPKDSKPRIESSSLQKYYKNTCQNIEPLNLTHSSEEEAERSVDYSNDDSSLGVLKIVDKRSRDNIKEPKETFDNTSEYEDTSKFGSDFDADSFLEDEYRESRPENQSDISEVSIPKSVDNDVEELYNKLEKSLDLRTIERPDNFDIARYVTLTPLTEESTAVRVDSIVDITPTRNSISQLKEIKKENISFIKNSEVDTKIMPIEPTEETDKNVIFTNNSGVKVKLLPTDEDKTEPFKLPPINNQSCPSSPHLNSLFGKAGTLPGLFESQRIGDRWEIGTKDLASGESAHINGRSGNPPGTVLKPNEKYYLPSIYIEGHINYGDSNTVDSSRNPKSSIVSSDTPRETISIQERIKELKMSTGRRLRMPKYSSTPPESRSLSPGSASLDESRLCDAAERGCDVLCCAVIKNLRTQSWFEVVEILEELPKMLEKFWCVITEQRIADLIRQVSVHVDSPRTQVARVACNTLATILKNTNYTKKPDFYEAVTSLLVKTGSFSKPVRRAANVALDDIVCGVELSQSVTALCVHGVSHKSHLVRCAAARLLVVCTALAGGGRELLRARPPTAAVARRHALRALAALLDDKSIDTRKYAERLYSMLRPLTNFEAYYLTDVEVELASKQMKKYDQLLLCGAPKDTR